MTRREQLNSSQVEEANKIQRQKKPQVGWLKCNVDAAILIQQGVISLGYVIRDEYGSYVATKNQTIFGLLGLALVEEMCCKEALNWVKNLGFTKVIIELDNQQLIQVLHNFDRDYSYFNALIDDCKILSNDLCECFFMFVNRLTNRIIHVLAKAIGFMIGI